MKKYSFLLASILFFAATSDAQTKIKLGSVMDHVSDSVTVTGKIFGTGRFMPISTDSTTLICMGEEYPDQLLTLVIPHEFKALFGGVPENDWIGKVISVTGRIHLYREKPEIIVTSPAKIQVLTN